ncbi:CgeB family protein [Methylolobus aquaticus]
MKILLVGPAKPGSTTLHRALALRALGHDVDIIDTWRDPNWQEKEVILSRLVSRMYRAGLWNAVVVPDLNAANHKVIEAVHSQNYEVLWLDKALTIHSSTLLAAKTTRPALRLVGFSPDDMLARHNHSRQFLDQLPYYDIFFTTKSYNVAELLALGCRRVEFIGNAYDPGVHRPVQGTVEDRRLLGGQVGFIGSFERERAEAMLFLAQHGIPVRIFGGNWAHRTAPHHRNLIIERRTLLDHEYARAVGVFDINLHFLRKANRDLQTTRSVEIPACGGFMLAERSEEHEALFCDGEEAVFFDSHEDLLNKVRHFLAWPEKARRIAHGGRLRCLKSGYSNPERLAYMLQKLRDLTDVPLRVPGESS